MKQTHRHRNLAWNIRWMFPLFAGGALAAAVISCNGELPNANQTKVTPEVVRSETGRDESPDVTAEELSELVDANSTFAFDLYHTLRATSDGNLFFSPYSISLAFAMTYAGARGETEHQMADTLQFLLPQDRLHPAFNRLDFQLSSRSGGGDGEDGGGFQLNIANAVWGQKDYDFLDTYLDKLAESYGAGVRPVDFKESPEESRITINDWVADRTGERIRDLIPQNAIDRLTRLVLTNAIYFKARWFHTFEEGLTDVGPFYLLDGGESEASMMKMEGDRSLGYFRGEGYQAVKLLYEDGETSMTILLPDAGTFREFEESMDANLVAGILGDIEDEDVVLTMPKFKFDSDFKLNDALKIMGMRNAFSESASDFSGVDGRSCMAMDNPCLLISGAFHKAFVTVDEEGTEAAAATAIITRAQSATIDPTIEVSVDRPFIFLIQDEETRAILFLGRVVDPIP